MSMAVLEGTCSSRPLTTVALIGKFLECSSTSCGKVRITSSSEMEEWEVFLGSIQSSLHMPDRSLLGWLEMGVVTV